MKPHIDNIGSINTLAMLSLILGLLFFVIGPLGSFPGIICGIIALVQFHKYGIRNGRGIAVSGVIVCTLGLMISAFFMMFFMKAYFNDGEFLNALSELLKELSESPVEEEQ